MAYETVVANFTINNNLHYQEIMLVNSKPIIYLYINSSLVNLDLIQFARFIENINRHVSRNINIRFYETIRKGCTR